MRSPYEVLGVKPDASAEEIRRVYRRVAKQTHPDLHPGDQAAETRFKELSAAYDLLSDEAKRARFDRGEIDADGRETTFAGAGAGGDGFDPFSRAAGARRAGGGRQDFNFSFGPGQSDDLGDVFAHIFGADAARAGGRAKGGDRRHTVTVKFLDAVNGTHRRIDLPGGRSLDVTIPAGIEDGQVLRLKGQGAPGPAGAGDFLLEVRVTPDSRFRRAGNDLHVDVPISLAEAVEGGRIEVELPGATVAMAVPPHSNTGRVLRLKGKGVAGGDAYITLRVTLPETIDDEFAAFVRDWSARHAYNPRART